METLITHVNDAIWQKHQETLLLSPSGNEETHREATILSLVGARQNNGRSLEDNEFEASSDPWVVEKGENVRVRVRFCLMTDHDVCGDYTEAEGELIFFLNAERCGRIS